MTARIDESEEQVIVLKLRPRQAILVNMMWGLSSAILCGDSAVAELIVTSLHGFTCRYRLEAPEEAREINGKISNIRNAFTDEQLRALGITNYRIDLATGKHTKERP